MPGKNPLYPFLLKRDPNHHAVLSRSKQFSYYVQNCVLVGWKTLKTQGKLLSQDCNYKPFAVCELIPDTLEWHSPNSGLEALIFWVTEEPAFYPPPHIIYEYWVEVLRVLRDLVGLLDTYLYHVKTGHDTWHYTHHMITPNNLMRALHGSTDPSRLALVNAP